MTKVPHEILEAIERLAEVGVETEKVVSILDTFLDKVLSDAAELDSRCPACGSPIDYCQGHGEIGDPLGADILARHDDGDHTNCHPEGCDKAGKVEHQLVKRNLLRGKGDK